ncbi:hypothetical protein OIU85_006832 [Salix viminalis]|uniref:Uncharacterized protein n=1 Tax=Salix viminalis TaxID=40686 RepID=A0A9Q0PM83_SALVM|nr:hypothetical protein OIU85_006832 [Salix viminalis]
MGYLFLVLLTILCLFASSTSLHDHKPSRLLSDSTASKTDSLKESRLGATAAHEHGISSIGDDSSERNGIAHSSKFSHGSVYEGEHGGAAAGAADTSNGGGDDHGSGAAVVTGAAMNNHTSNDHRNAAGSHHANVMVLPILITTALVALIVH